MPSPRESGVLLHPTSLPGGRLGTEAYRFIDWLQKSGQTWWQILPLGPPDASGSPYSAASAFAGWPGLLAKPDARVTAREIDGFVATHPYWAGGWAAYAGDGALADQVRFQREWGATRTYAAERGIRIVGDIPIYVAPGSADHVFQPELFNPDFVAGVPPDDWTKTGQLWGNPLYDWDTMRATGYRWWTERFRRTFELVDLSRIDHFRAFVAYWAVPKRNRTARIGTWHRAPGREVFDAAKRELGRLPLIAEDLGVITEPVEHLRDELKLPGMIILQFALSESLKNPQPISGMRSNRVIYTGTHDNPTTAQWWDEASASEQQNAEQIFERAGIDRPDPVWSMIELALRAPCHLSIIPAQDILGLGSQARMNTPGRATGNWSWRLTPGDLSDELAAALLAATRSSGRAPH